MNPDELRSRLAVAFPDETPPPDLAARAERTAGRLRRRRTVAVAAAAALAVAVPLSVAAIAGPDRALPPAAPADPACTWDDRAIPRQGVATTDAEVAAWGFRGDPAFRERAVQIAALNGDVRSPRILYADGSLVVYAARLPQLSAQWTLVALHTDANGKELSSAGGRVPYPGPDAAISLLVPTRRLPVPPPEFVYGSQFTENTLVALAPPGSTSVTFRGCRNGTPFTVERGGDTLVENVGTLDAPGRLGVRTAAGWVGYAGAVADLPFSNGVRPAVALPPVEPIPVPAGTRQVYREVGQGVVLGTPRTVTADRGTVFIRCRAIGAAGPTEVSAGVERLGAARCDGSVELLAENVPLDGPISLGPGDGPPPLVSYQLIVVSG